MTMKISGEEVRKHAEQVDEAGERVGESKAAAAEIRASDAAYGHFVGKLVEMFLNEHTDHVLATYTESIKAFQALSAKLRAMADDFDASDERAADRLKGTR